MSHNNIIYKGYRLSARVSRVSVGGSSRPAFTATVSVEEAMDEQEAVERHVVPFFATGGFVASPAMAVDTAINHGRCMVDAHTLAR